MEALLITAAIQNRELWERISLLLSPEDLGTLGSILWEEIGKYYKADNNAREVQVPILMHLLEARLPDPKHVTLCQRLVVGSDLKVSEANVERMIWEIKKQQQGIKLASALAANDDTSIRQHIGKYQSLLDFSLSSGSSGTDSATLPEVSDFLTQKADTGNRILIAPQALNEKLGGGAQRGNVLLVYGRPEVGKTLFLVNLISHFLPQGLKTLYLGNEEPLHQIVRRILTNLSGIPGMELELKKKEVSELVNKKGYGLLRAAHIGGMTPQFISDLVAKESPDVIVLDQLRNLKVKSESRVNQLEESARFMREIAATYNALVIETTQAGDSANQKLVVEMGDVDWSNTGIPGAVDVMIGIGSNTEYEQLGRRMLALPKNKLSGDHGHFPITVDTLLHRVGSL